MNIRPPCMLTVAYNFTEEKMIAMSERKLLCLSLILCPILSLCYSPIQAGYPIDSIPPVTLPAEDTGTYIRTGDGLIVYPDPLLSGNAAAVKLQVVTNNIIRVISSPSRESDAKKSLITIYGTDPSAKWDIKNDKSTVVLTTSLLKATVTIATGAVSFTDPAGAPILSEKANGGRSFESAIFDGQSSYQIRQTFTTRPDEAL